MRRVPALLALLACAAACGGHDEERSPQPEAVPLRRPDDPPTARRSTLEELRADHAAVRHAADGQGRAWLELAPGEAALVQASGRGSWTIVYEAGELGVASGGSVRLLSPPFWEWSTAQDMASEELGYTTVESLAAGVELEVFTGEWTVAELRGRALAPGERLRFTYGAGPAGVRADRYAERGERFWLAIDGDGDGVPGILRDSPTIDVLPTAAARLVLTATSVVRPGESATLRVALLDRVGNAGVDFVGDVLLSTEAAGVELPERVSLGAEDKGLRTLEVRCSEPGVVRIAGEAALERGPTSAASNPILVSESAPRVRWGDLHGHSNLSDGSGTPEDYFRYARDVAGLDVVALTDHDHWGVRFLDQSPDLWSEIRTQCERFHDPGRFVTLLGYEWTNWIHGHRHVLYFGDDGPVLSSIDPAFETPAQLWSGLRALGLPALTFAHHSAGGPIATDWSYAPDPELEPVTEIVSVHGASEAPDAPAEIYRPLAGNFVRDVLDRGYRLGFIGSGDSHDGHPGLAQLSSRTSGLAALVTEDLTRAGVRAALQERRVWATNGARILLQCALDGHRMGSAVPPSAAGVPALLYLRVIACGPLASLDLVRSGGVQRIPAEGRLELALELEVPELADGEYLYLRAIQEDGSCAWSSPFFVQAEVPAAAGPGAAPEPAPAAGAQGASAPGDEPR